MLLCSWIGRVKMYCVSCGGKGMGEGLITVKAFSLY